MIFPGQPSGRGTLNGFYASILIGDIRERIGKAGFAFLQFWVLIITRTHYEVQQ